MKKDKVSISWSGGKDAAFALYLVMKSGNYEVASLHTTIDAISKKVGLHGINESLIEQQALMLDLPLDKIYINKPGATLSYEEEMLQYYKALVQQEVRKVICGDIFLEDLRKYKEEIANKAGIELEFPLWGYSTQELAQEMVESGFKTMICAVDTKYFSLNDLGKIVDENFLKNLPDNVDPCGEKGEFHSFVFDSPLFKEPIEVLEKERYTEKYSFQDQLQKPLQLEYGYIDLVLAKK